MTVKDLTDKLEELEISKEEFAYDDYDVDLKQYFGEFEEIEHEGGEGEGEKYHIVWYFKDHDLYIRLDGYYTSYNGTDFDDYEFYEVRPKQVTITVYEKPE